jgi:hypothetical protein
VNIVTGTHSLLDDAFLGAGGVYREPLVGRRVGVSFGGDFFAVGFDFDDGTPGG